MSFLNLNSLVQAITSFNKAFLFIILKKASKLFVLLRFNYKFASAINSSLLFIGEVPEWSIGAPC